MENGYKRSQLLIIIDKIKRKRFTGNRIKESNDANETLNKLPITTLPWIPGLSPKLRKAYKKAGYVVKSNKNLQKFLTSKNKSMLPIFSLRIFQDNYTRNWMARKFSQSHFVQIFTTVT